MGVPTVSKTTPANNATDVDTRAVLSITFSEAVDKTTVTEGTVVLSDDETLETLKGSISFGSSNTVVSFLPERELRSNKLYTLSIAGAADDLPSGNVKSATGGSLAETHIVHFRVETERFVSLDEVSDRTDIDHVAPIREESELAAASGYIKVTSTIPTSFSTNNKNLDEIVITFDEDIDLTDFDADTMFSMELNPILDLNNYLGNYDSNGNPKLYVQDNDVPIVLPSGNVVAASNTITWTRDQPTLTADQHPRHNTFPFNAEIIVTIDSSVTSSTSGNALVDDVKFAFTTEFYPMISGVRTLRLDVGPSVDEIYDDTINRVILKRSIEAWETVCREINLDDPRHDAVLFARWGSVLDVIEILSLKADLQRGVRKRLGEFQVDFSNRTFAKDTGRIFTARSNLEAAERRLRLSCKSLRTRRSNLGSNASAGQVIFRGVRSWDTVLTRRYGAESVPGANSPHQRNIMKQIDQGARAFTYFSPDSVDNGYIYVYNTGKSV